MSDPWSILCLHYTHLIGISGIQNESLLYPSTNDRNWFPWLSVFSEDRFSQAKSEQPVFQDLILYPSYNCTTGFQFSSWRWVQQSMKALHKGRLWIAGNIFLTKKKTSSSPVFLTADEQIVCLQQRCRWQSVGHKVNKALPGKSTQMTVLWIHRLKRRHKIQDYQRGRKAKDKRNTQDADLDIKPGCDGCPNQLCGFSSSMSGKGL